ncbi:Dedicator of cytokinesis protein 8 [Gonapodya sp. JEL0774]|nr:Dedicator of cytokinesis protein 8 [Gonapodya sp. JEL0774]
MPFTRPLGGESTRISKLSPARTRETTAEQDRLPGSFPSLPLNDSTPPTEPQPIGNSASIQHLAPTSPDFAIPDWDSIVNSSAVSADVHSDRHPQLLIFPSDTIRVSQVPRKLRTTRSTVPDELARSPQLPVHLKSLVDFYSSESWTVLSRQCHHHSEYPAINVDDEGVRTLPDIVYDQDEDVVDEVDGIGDERGRDFALVFQNIIGTGGNAHGLGNSATNHKDGSPGSTLTTDSATGFVARKSSIRSSSASMDIDKADSIPKFLEYKPGITDSEAEVARSLSLTLTQEPLENIYVTIAAYDCASRARLSEDFTIIIEPSSSPSAGSSPGSPSSASERVRTRKALLSISDPGPSVYLLVRLEKTLEGDMVACGERLGRPLKASEVQASRESVARLGGYRQPVGWCAVQLFDDQRRLMGSSISADTLETNQIYVHSADKLADEDLCALALGASGSRPSAGTGTVFPPLKRLKQLAGRFSVRVTEVLERPGSQVSNCMTPSLVPIRPFVIDPDVPVVRELQEFPLQGVVAVSPHLGYVNNLYVYPVSVDLRKAGWLGFRARNIVCKMQLMDGDGQVVKGRIFSPATSSQAFSDAASTPVLYHSQTPTFYTELKMALPAKLTPDYHILFSFSHVACKSTLAAGQQKEHEIGKAFLPLFDKEGYSLLKNAVHHLKVARQLGPRYWKEPLGTTWLDQSVPLFAVRTKSISSVYSQDTAVTQFFREIDKPSAEMDPKVSGALSIVFFDLVTKEAPTDDSRKSAFEALNEVVMRVDREADLLKRVSAAKVYIKYRFKTRESWGSPAYERILAAWIDFLDKPAQIYLSAFDEDDSVTLLELKFEYLRILCGYEYSMDAFKFDFEAETPVKELQQVRPGMFVDTTRKSFSMVEESPSAVSPAPVDADVVKKKLLGHLCSETALIALDTVEILVKEIDQRDELADKQLLRLFDVLMFIATGRQSLEVDEFCDLLNEIGKDSVHMSKYRHDSEMLGDILYRIAKGYITSPDLRLAYLGKLGDVHIEASAHSEAALCRLHQAKLVAEFLLYKNTLTYTDVVLSVVWNSCSPTLNEKEIAEEGCLKEDGVCQGPEFTTAGLVGLLEQSLDHYRDAKMYENVNAVAKVLMPIYEKESLYENLAVTHKMVGQCFEELNRLTKSGKRLSATYFRVAFFGKKFGDLDGLEFIYKEKPATSLAEIAARFTDGYSKGDRCFHSLNECGN